MTDDDKAREITHGLIQGYIGPDHKVQSSSSSISWQPCYPHCSFPDTWPFRGGKATDDRRLRYLENRMSANDPCDRSTRHHSLQKFNRPSQNKGAVSNKAGGSELYLVLMLDCLFDDTLTILVVAQRRSGFLPRVIPIIWANLLHTS
jgi:hypothetical protein